MLHSRDHLLSDVAALLEIDAVQAVHVGFVRKRIAIDKVESAPRNAGSDAVSLIGSAVDQLGANQIGGLLRERLGHKNTPAEDGVARIGECQIRRYSGMAVPSREHAKTVRQILDRDLGAQFVEAKLVRERLRQRARAVDQEAAAVAGRRLGDQKIRCYFALRGQQGPEAAEAGPKQRNVCRDSAGEKVARDITVALDHAPVGKKRRFHVKISCDMLQRNVSRQVINDKGCTTWVYLSLILRSRRQPVSRRMNNARLLCIKGDNRYEEG